MKSAALALIGGVTCLTIIALGSAHTAFSDRCLGNQIFSFRLVFLGLDALQCMSHLSSG